LVRASDS